MHYVYGIWGFSSLFSLMFSLRFPAPHTLVELWMRLTRLFHSNDKAQPTWDRQHWSLEPRTVTHIHMGMTLNDMETSSSRFYLRLVDAAQLPAFSAVEGQASLQQDGLLSSSPELVLELLSSPAALALGQVTSCTEVVSWWRLMSLVSDPIIRRLSAVAATLTPSVVAARPNEA